MGNFPQKEKTLKRKKNHHDMEIRENEKTLFLKNSELPPSPLIG
jgi:hypothetical protein